MAELKLPGRLGDPASTLETDPRLDPRIREALSAAGTLQTVESPVNGDSSYEDCLDFCAAFEAANMEAHPLIAAAAPDFPTVTTREEEITGVDGNPIKLYIHEPAERSGPVPCIVHTHGGGMVLMTAKDPNFERLRNSQAAQGLVVVGVEFRNGGGVLGNHPFPAGLNDCASAAQWAHANRDTLDISSIVISGESGGGNLCIATTLKAKQDGWLDAIDGVYSFCPYISGAYANPPAELISLIENNEYMIDIAMMGALAKVYDPTGAQASNPLAWPLHASVDDLKGLPPHVISVNELDPLRDEGLAFARKLLAAGVSTVTHTANGTPHAGDLSFPDAIPDVFDSTIRSIYTFATRLN